MANERHIRKLFNTKQNVIEFKGIPSIRGMGEGQIAITKDSNKQLAIYRKNFGKLWKSYMSHDGNQYVDRALIADELKYKRKFTDYRHIIHNFSRDIGTDKIYIPWFGVSENVSMDYVSSAMLAPFKMTLYKLFVRPDGLTDTSGDGSETNDADLTFTLDKQDDGDTTVDSIATFTYTTLLNNESFITINQSDWSAVPVVEAGDKIGISIDSSADPSGTIIWYITSVWKVEVTI